MIKYSKTIFNSNIRLNIWNLSVLLIQKTLANIILREGGSPPTSDQADRRHKPQYDLCSTG